MEEKPVKKNSKFKKITVRILGTLFALIILAVASLYLPFVQDYAVDTALDKVNSGGDMTISVDRVRLTFPLNLRVDNLTIRQQTDTMLTARKIRGAISVLPLLRGRVGIDDLEVDSLVYAMGNPDSVMQMSAQVSLFRLSDSSVRLSDMDIDLGEALLDGGDMELNMKRDTTAVTAPDSVAPPMKMNILAHSIVLRNVNYRMTMEGLIDSLDVTLHSAALREGKIGMETQSIEVQEVELDSIVAAYYTPAVLTPSQSTDSVASLPWTVQVHNISLRNSNALYATSGAVPLPGFDPSYIQVSDINLQVDSLYNRGTSVAVPLQNLEATERCGVKLRARGRFAMDSVAMHADSFNITTGFSTINLNAMMGVGDFATDPTLPLRLNASARLAQVDLISMFPSMEQMITALPQYSVPEAEVDVDGTVGDLHLNRFRIAVPRHLELTASGNLRNVMDFNNVDGDIKLGGSINNMNFVKKTFLPKASRDMINIPNLTLSGNVRMRRGVMDGNLTARTPGGNVALKARWDNRHEGYDATMDFNSFPIQSILPTLGVRDLSANATVSGNGYDPFAKSTTIKASIDLDSVTYNNVVYRNIVADATLHDGLADLTLTSDNRDADFTLSVNGNIAPTPYDFDLHGEIRNINLQALGMAPNRSFFNGTIAGTGSFDPDGNIIDAALTVPRLRFVSDPTLDLTTTDINLSLHADDSLTRAELVNRDLKLTFESPSSLDSLSTRFSAAIDSLSMQMGRFDIRVNDISDALPPFTLDLTAGNNNSINDYLRLSGKGVKKIAMTASNDSTLHLNGIINHFTAPNMVIDTISLNLRQMGKYLVLEAKMDNAPGTMDNFAHVVVHGFVAGSKAGLFCRQSNLQGEMGYRIGLMTQYQDSIIRLNLIPYDPVIAYKKWTVNQDNFISLNLAKRHLDADLVMKNDESSLHLYTEHNDSIEGQEDIVLNISDIKIADWIALNPFAPKIKGDLSANLRLRENHDEKGISGDGTVKLQNFIYGKQRVGDFDLDLDVTTNTRGALAAHASLSVDSAKVLILSGVMNDTVSKTPVRIDLELDRFPLKTVNPFLPPRTATLSGSLSGMMDVTGSLTQPLLNGYLEFDSAQARVTMLGSDFKFAPTTIPVDSNMVSLNNFAITACNKNPLTINGYVNLRDLMNPSLALDLKADNMQIVNSDRPRGADIYGKGFVDLDASVKGDMSVLDIDAALRILSATNITYVMAGAESAITSHSTGNMVKFVNFADTTQVIDADSLSAGAMSMNLNATLIMEPGTDINVDLSTDGKNKVSLKGNANLNYTMDAMGADRLVGRYNITGGFARYTPPFMSEKHFAFQDGGYVSFNGNMMNPQLNIRAIDDIKANVTQEGQNSRLVDFLVILTVRGSLEQMDINFDLATEQDITISNELQSMSAEQRASQAMNLLLYNIYTGPGTRGNANIGGNTLYSFLESQINSWAANNIKGVDLSFGINQYDKTINGNTSTTTSYSYKVSKSLFDDRFKIVVGGNYSNDAESDAELAESLINDVSFEYYINRNGTMILRIFRHNDFESILEGEVTETGVGFVYKRKLRRLGDLFRRYRRNQTTIIPQEGKPIN
ncbi:MAG: translocation/assembly module TamB domain-containing protein [Muribaculaceae bacterium]|nr:translocation/assembly module TamB domain-containing protein [Muribaculaceae bacterium]